MVDQKKNLLFYNLQQMKKKLLKVIMHAYLRMGRQEQAKPTLCKEN